jgi:hypothetical protein
MNQALIMRLMAYGRRAGVRCDHCGTSAARHRGLRPALSAENWLRNVHLMNRHACASSVEALPSRGEQRVVEALIRQSMTTTR